VRWKPFVCNPAKLQAKKLSPQTCAHVAKWSMWRQIFARNTPVKACHSNLIARILLKFGIARAVF